MPKPRPLAVGYSPRKSAKPKRVSAETLHVGPALLCPCCDTALYIREAATEELPKRSVRIDQGTLESIYGSLLENAGEGLRVRCSQVTVLGHRASPASKLWYADLSGDRIVGPFCRVCLQRFLRNREHPGGRQPRTKIYEVRTDLGVIQLLKFTTHAETKCASPPAFRDLF